MDCPINTILEHSCQRVTAMQRKVEVFCFFPYSDTFDELILLSPVPIAYGLRSLHSVSSLGDQRNERRLGMSRVGFSFCVLAIHSTNRSTLSRSYLILCAARLFLFSLVPGTPCPAVANEGSRRSLKDTVFILTNPDRNIRVFLAHTQYCFRLFFLRLMIDTVVEPGNERQNLTIMDWITIIEMINFMHKWVLSNKGVPRSYAVSAICLPSFLSLNTCNFPPPEIGGFGIFNFWLRVFSLHVTWKQT